MLDRITPVGVLEVTQNGVTETFKNIVTNSGRSSLKRLLAGDSAVYVNRIRLGDCVDNGVVDKDNNPPDRSDSGLVHELTSINGVRGGTFELDRHYYPDEIVKVSRDIGTPGSLTAGDTSLLTDAGADFISAGVKDTDTVSVKINGQDYVLGVMSVNGSSELRVENPGQVAGAVGYTVQTPGTQVVFEKTVSGDNFPVSEFGPQTVVHEAGLVMTDDSMFNRIVFHRQDPNMGLLLEPSGNEGQRTDILFRWTITF